MGLSWFNLAVGESPSDSCLALPFYQPLTETLWFVLTACEFPCDNFPSLLSRRYQPITSTSRFNPISDCNRPGRAGPDQAWPGLAYGGAGEAWPIGRRLLARGLGRPRPAYRLGLKIYREKNGHVTKRNTRIRRKTGTFGRKSPNGCSIEPHRVGRGAFVVTGGQTQQKFRLFLARFTPVRPIGRPVGPIGFIGQRNNGLGRPRLILRRPGPAWPMSLGRPIGRPGPLGTLNPIGSEFPGSCSSSSLLP